MVGNLNLFSDQILRWQEEEQKIVIVAPTKGQISRIHELMNEWGFDVDVDLGRLSEGFHFKSANLIFIPEHEIFGRSHKHRQRKKTKSKSDIPKITNRFTLLLTPKLRETRVFSCEIIFQEL